MEAPPWHHGKASLMKARPSTRWFRRRWPIPWQISNPTPSLPARPPLRHMCSPPSRIWSCPHMMPSRNFARSSLTCVPLWILAPAPQTRLCPTRMQWGTISGADGQHRSSSTWGMERQQSHCMFLLQWTNAWRSWCPRCNNMWLFIHNSMFIVKVYFFMRFEGKLTSTCTAINMTLFLVPPLILVHVLYDDHVFFIMGICNNDSINNKSTLLSK
jgi:hypothetical protein